MSSFSPDMDLGLGVALGMVSNVEVWAAYGVGKGSSAGDPFDLGAVGAEFVLPPLAGTKLQVVGSDPSDGGSIVFEGLDVDGERAITETLVFSGTSPAVTGQLFSRVNRAYLLSGSIAADLEIQPESGPEIYGAISKDSRVMEQALYSFPKNRRGMFGRLSASVTRDTKIDTDVDLEVWVKPHHLTEWRRVFLIGLQRRGTTASEFRNSYPELWDALDVKLTAVASKSDASVAARISGLHGGSDA